MKQNIVWTILLVGNTLMASTAAFSQERDNPCMADVEKLCKGVLPTGGRVMKCLNDNEAKLSGACRKTLGMVKLEWAACQSDADKLCRTEAAQKSGVSKCLKDNESKVSAGCKSAMNDAQERMDKNHPCVRDAQKFCKNVQPGEGRIMGCLSSHQGELSPACRAVVQSKQEVKKK